MSHWCWWPVVRIITFPLPHLLFHFRINSGSFTFFGPSNFCPQYTRKPPVPSYCLNQQESAHFHCWHVFTSSSAFLSCPLSKQWILYAVDLITNLHFCRFVWRGKRKGVDCCDRAESCAEVRLQALTYSRHLTLGLSVHVDYSCFETLEV